MNHCPFGGHFFALPTKTELPVECPECGAIRTLKANRPGECDEYPAHQCLDGTARDRKRWKQINGLWQIVEVN